MLDDSTDETRGDRRAQGRRASRARGLDVVYIHRVDRTRLQGRRARRTACSVAKGELVAIFDADFVPQPDFLRAAVHHFADPKVGMVQARWGHINRDYSLLTRVAGADARRPLRRSSTPRAHRSGRFFNFNGTGRHVAPAAIDDAGGWQHDTLTEDLDLSYRAQLARLEVRLPAGRRRAGRAAGAR